MEIIAKVAAVVQSLLGTWAEDVAQGCEVIQRQRKFTAATLARTLVLGFLAEPDASDEALAQCAGLCGVEVTPQAVEQRFTPRLVAFMGGQGVFWLSRLQFGTSVFSTLAAPLRLLSWLAEQAGPVVDQPILLGAERKLACRLVAWRVPEEVANRRRQKLIDAARSKSGRTPSRERLAWCDWMILVTNVPSAKLTPREMAVLYRARWQIELLFKRWKSLGLVAELTGSTVPRQMARLWSRLIGVLMQHWLLLTSVWGDMRHSLAKASQAIRRHALLLAAALGSTVELEAAIETLCRAVRVTARQNKRRLPSTFELLNNPSLLEYGLT